uniref:Uncharacterized protein n=1 Tax=Romanomermis culicivorax TaxID=13658 RepID=A0A915K9E3_ROMCU
MLYDTKERIYHLGATGGPPVQSVVLKGFLGDARAAPSLSNVGVGLIIPTRAHLKWPGLQP